jgi:glycosyltransferase involved in cell wall biosynthesis
MANGSLTLSGKRISLHVLYLLGEGLDDPTTYRTNVGTLIRALLSRGHSVTVVGVRTNPDTGANSVTVPMDGVVGLSMPDQTAMLRYLWTSRRTYDAVFAYNARRPNALLPLLRLMGKRTIVKTDHVYGVSWGSPRSAVRTLATTVLPLRTASIALVESPAMQRRLRRYLPAKRTLVLPNCIRVGDLGPPENSAPDTNVLYVGRLIYMKGADLLIESFAAVAKRYPAWRLDFVGPPNEEDYARGLERRVRELDLHGRVHFHGPAFGDDLRRHFLCAGIFSLPSRKEGMSNVLTEAMGYGKAILATDVGEADFQLDGGRCGVLVKPTVEALAAGLERLLMDAEDRRRLGNLARQRAVDAFDETTRYADLNKLLDRAGM